MPVRSLTSSVLKWPDAHAVDRAVRIWAAALVQRRGDLQGVAYIGSYARGDWGVGSDLDLIVVLKQSQAPFWQRASDLDLAGFPVPTEALVYTVNEWQTLAEEHGRFFRTIEQEGVWVYRAPTWQE